jgi:hypothetical protein
MFVGGVAANTITMFLIRIGVPSFPLDVDRFHNPSVTDKKLHTETLRALVTVWCGVVGVGGSGSTRIG